MKFPKSHPEWLVNKFGNRLELDGYNEQLKLAFEFQGQQHYEYFSFFHKNHDKFKRRKKNDLVKVRLCRANDIILIRVPYYISYDNMQNYIIRQYKLKTGMKISELSKYEYKKFNVYTSSRLKEMQKIAEGRGGICLSKNYIGSNKKMLWECENGHQWNATPNNIKHRGSWCPICCNKRIKERRKKLFKEVKNIINSKGGICLSFIPEDSKTKILVECENGHHWSVYPRYIKYGHWYPVCWNIKKTILSPFKKI
ncbi:MAG: zinc-ribbon domain-containing protein [Promethearchaeota archaeon]